MTSIKHYYIWDAHLPIRFRAASFDDCRFVTNNPEHEVCVQLHDGRTVWLEEGIYDQLVQAGIAPKRSRK